MVDGLGKIWSLQMLDFFIHAQEHNEINIVLLVPKIYPYKSGLIGGYSNPKLI